MKRRAHILIAGLLMFSILSMLTTCCVEERKEPVKVDIPKDLLQEGDLVFRRGTGIASRIVLTADRQGVYSHTGIVKKKHGKWYVIHAVPGETDFKEDPDRIKMELIDSFFTHSKAICGAVMRMKADSSACCRAAIRAERFYKKKILFDHQYDLKDTTEMYCTELIDYVFRKEGIDLTEGRLSRLSIPGFHGSYLLPNDIAQNKNLCIIYNF